MASEYKVLLIGGRGTIGSGLRTYMPRLDPRYRMVSVDLPGAPDKATGPDAGGDFIDLDIMESPDDFRAPDPRVRLGRLSGPLWRLSGHAPDDRLGF